MLTVAAFGGASNEVAGVAGFVSVLLLITALITKELVVVLPQGRARRLNRALNAVIVPLAFGVAGAAAARFG